MITVTLSDRKISSLFYALEAKHKPKRKTSDKTIVLRIRSKQKQEKLSFSTNFLNLFLYELLFSSYLLLKLKEYAISFCVTLRHAVTQNKISRLVHPFRRESRPRSRLFLSSPRAFLHETACVSSKNNNKRF